MGMGRWAIRGSPGVWGRMDMKQKDVCELWVWLDPGHPLGSIP